jgi:acetate---CoA ligase (ADP-forming)
MFDLAAALGSQPLPRGRRVAVVTNAGGPAILCADACEAGGLVLPELSAATRSRLATFLSPAASTVNPVDMIASATPEQYAQAIETVLGSGEVDALITIYIPVGLSGTAAVVAAVRAGVTRARAAGTANAPVLACSMAEQGVGALSSQGGERIPSYAFPEAAARTLGKIAAYAEWRTAPQGLIPDFDDLDLPSAREVCRKALAQRGAGWLTAEETRAVLAAVRLPLPTGGVARAVEEAVELARRVGFPVAVKLASHQLVHKTDVGGVCLNLGDTDAVRDAFEKIRNRLVRENRLGAMEGVIVQPMSEGVEVMAGVTQDPLFGPLVAFGLGGVHVEILADVCFRVTPLTDRDAAEMVRAIRGYRLLTGYRGHPPADTEAIQEVLLRLSRLVEELSEIGEVDLNPVFALAPGQGCLIADARIEVRPQRDPGITAPAAP